MSLGIWNNIDDTALYLGLERLDGETNDELIARIKLFSRWKYGTSYEVQAHSLPIQLGLKTETFARIKTINGNPFLVDVGWDYMTVKEVANNGEFIRIALCGKDDTFQKIKDTFDSSENFELTIISPNFDLGMMCDFLVRGTNIKSSNDLIEGTSSFLTHGNIIKSSVLVDNPSLRYSVDGIINLKKRGDFYIDSESGYIQIYDQGFTGANVAYQYYDKSFYLEISELCLKPMNEVFKYGVTDANCEILTKLTSGLLAGG